MENFDKDYNTRRPHMIIPEYGRNIQKMVEYATTLNDREERNKIAHAIISVMGQLNPHLRDIADFKHKLWDHLFIISDFKLDVDSPYPLPDKETIFRKPDKLNYPQKKIKYKHYGKSIENMIDVAKEMDEGEEKNALIKITAELMKRNYLAFNRESVDDGLIFGDLKRLSHNKIDFDEEQIKLTSTSEILALDNNRKRTNSKGGGSKKKQNGGYKKRRH